MTEHKLCLTRYTSMSCGVTESYSGSLLKISELIEALSFVLDDDDLVRERIEKILSFLAHGKD